ncbi:hypothetical protein ACOL29_08940 [Aliarcobacter butzleri]
MNEFNINALLPIVISFVAMVISYKAYKTANKVNESTQLWQEYDINLRNEEMVLKKDKEYKEMAKPYIDIMYNCYIETKELMSEFSLKACRAKNNICEEINKYDKEFYYLNGDLNTAIDRIIIDNERNILFQIPETLFSSLNYYSNLDECYLEEDSSDKVKQSLNNLYKRISPDKRQKLYNHAIEQLKKVHLIYRNNKEIIDNMIELMENEYMKFKRYYFGSRLNILHEDYLEMLNLLKYIRYIERHYFYYNEIHPSIAISKMFIQISNIMIVNRGILEISRLENYRNLRY